MTLTIILAAPAVAIVIALTVDAVRHHRRNAERDFIEQVKQRG